MIQPRVAPSGILLGTALLLRFESAARTATPPCTWTTPRMTDAVHRSAGVERHQVRVRAGADLALAGEAQKPGRLLVRAPAPARAACRRSSSSRSVPTAHRRSLHQIYSPGLTVKAGQAPPASELTVMRSLGAPLAA